MRRRKIYTHTLPDRVKEKYSDGKNMIYTDYLLMQLEKYLENAEKEHQIFSALSSKQDMEKLFAEAMATAKNQEDKDRIEALRNMPKVSIRNYMTFTKSGKLVLEYVIPSVLDDEYWKKKNL